MQSQREFLLAAMAELGTIVGLDRPLTRNEMCDRMGCSRATFDKWMLESDNGREMPEVVWRYVSEILQHERLKAERP